MGKFTVLDVTYKNQNLKESYINFNSKTKLSLNVDLFELVLEKFSIYAIIKHANLKGHCQMIA